VFALFFIVALLMNDDSIKENQKIFITHRGV